MEGLGDGYEAFVERLQMDIAASSAAKNPTRSSNSSNPPQSYEQIPRYASYPSPTNSFIVKREPSSAVSDSSARPSGSASLEVSMQEVVNSPVSSVPPRMPSPSQHFSSDVSRMPDAPPRRGGHRRAQSEIAVRLPDDLLFEHEFAFSGAEFPNLSDDAGEDFVSMYFDMEKLSSASANSVQASLDGMTIVSSAHHSRSLSVDGVLAEFRSERGSTGVISGPSDAPRPRHHHSNSMDGSTSFKQELLIGDSDSLESKKAMAAKKLAELALIDPKRAKRVLANRQSAARSKERKMRYISELERKVQTLQTEATTLSAQLTMLQRDTTGLTTENSELKLRLQAMEQEAQLRGALNDTLKEEVQRLKLTTGQLAAANGQSFNLGTQHIPPNQSLFQLSQQSHHLTTQQLQQVQISLNNHQRSVQQPNNLNFTQRGGFGSLQGISGSLGNAFGKSEGSSAAVSHTSSSSF